MRKKHVPPSKSKRVKAVARERVGTPRPARLVEERATREQPKHKKKLTEADE